MKNSGNRFVTGTFGCIGQAYSLTTRRQTRHAHDHTGLEQALGIEHNVVGLRAQLPVKVAISARVSAFPRLLRQRLKAIGIIVRTRGLSRTRLVYASSTTQSMLACG